MAYYDFATCPAPPCGAASWGIDLKYIGILFMAAFRPRPCAIGGGRRSAGASPHPDAVRGGGKGGLSHRLSDPQRRLLPLSASPSACVLTLFALHAPGWTAGSWRRAAAGPCGSFFVFPTGASFPSTPCTVFSPLSLPLIDQHPGNFPRPASPTRRRPCRHGRRWAGCAGGQGLRHLRRQTDRWSSLGVSPLQDRIFLLTRRDSARRK